MNKESNFESGRCQCGDITYTLDKNKVISAHHCHCKDCQRTTGSGKATILFIAKKYVDLMVNLSSLRVKALLVLMLEEAFAQIVVQAY